MATEMNGIGVSYYVEDQVHEYVKKLKRHGVKPRLATILVGDNPESELYIDKKKKNCEALEMDVVRVSASSNTSADILKSHVREFSDDKSIHGILIQLPLPGHIEGRKYEIFDEIDPKKDVDALSGEVVKHFYRGEWGLFLPCTPRAVLNLLQHYKINTEGADACVIGRNDITGKPIALILGGRICNATVDWCHRYTRDLGEHTRRADILVSCTGQKHLIKKEMVKKEAVVIDVGIKREGERLYGDVDYANVKGLASYITPVPGGVGPLTVAALMQNLVDAARYSLGMERAEYHL